MPQVLDRLATFEAEARPSGDVGKLLFVHEMAKSCGMVDLLAATYDVALMNPPYGKMPEACKDYCKENHRRGVRAHYPSTGNNLYSAFIERAIDLVGEGGFVGMLTSQTFMYLSTFKKCRKDVINSFAPPEVLCDTGYGVLDGAKVITAAAVLRKQAKPDTKRPCVAFRMFQEQEDQKEAVFVEALGSLFRGVAHPRAYLTSVATFRGLPSSVYSYWVPTSVSMLFGQFPPMDRDVARSPESRKIADAKQGLATGDNPRFVRFFWEVGPETIARSREETYMGKPWVPYALGGWLEVFQADIDNVVDWKNDGEALRALGTSRVQNEGFYFKEGISWHKSPQYPSNQTRMNARHLPEGTIFTVSVNGLFLDPGRLWSALAYLNSEFIFYVARIFENRNILNGSVGQFPYPDQADLGSIGQLAYSAYALAIVLRTTDEISPYFVGPALVMATQAPGQFGLPSGHVHSGQFRWPSDDRIRNDHPVLSDLFLDIFRTFSTPSDTLRQLGRTAWQREREVQGWLTSIQTRIDEAVYDLMEIGPEDRRHFAEEIAFRQCLPSIDEDDDSGEESDSEDEPRAILSEDDQGRPTPSLTILEAEFEEGPSGALSSTDTVEESDFVRDQVRRLLSYAVKVVMERDEDGIVALQPLGRKPGLSQLVKIHLGDWFGTETLEAKWSEAGHILGIPAEDWLAQDYFDFHVNMYRRRAIFWQLTSGGCLPRGTLPGAFSCLLFYHKLRANTLQDIVAHCLVDVLETAQAQFNATKTVLEGLQQRGARRREIDNAQRSFQAADRQYRELIEFRRRIQDLDTGARPVTPAPGPDAPWLKQKIAEVTGGPAYGRGWLPVLDYGVRVNIEPLKVAGILPRAADRIE